MKKAGSVTWVCTSKLYLAVTRPFPPFAKGNGLTTQSNLATTLVHLLLAHIHIHSNDSNIIVIECCIM